MKKSKSTATHEMVINTSFRTAFSQIHTESPGFLIRENLAQNDAFSTIWTFVDLTKHILKIGICEAKSFGNENHRYLVETQSTSLFEFCAHNIGRCKYTVGYKR